jgi:hypothetical protein
MAKLLFSLCNLLKYESSDINRNYTGHGETKKEYKFKRY